MPASPTLPCQPSRAREARQSPARGDAEQEAGAASLLEDAATAMAIPSFWHLQDCMCLLYGDAQSPLEVWVSRTGEIWFP